MCNCKQDKRLTEGYPFLTVDDLPEPLPRPQKPPREEIEWVEETGAERVEVEIVEPSPARQAELAARDELLRRLADAGASINRQVNFPPSGDPV